MAKLNLVRAAAKNGVLVSNIHPHVCHAVSPYFQWPDGFGIMIVVLEGRNTTIFLGHSHFRVDKMPVRADNGAGSIYFRSIYRKILSAH
jgi:hypothetical protein